MSEKQTTMNGYEISAPREKLAAAEFKDMVNGYGLGGNSPRERVESLKSTSPEVVALFLTDLNRRLQGSDESLIADRTIEVGQQETIAPDERAGLFIDLVEKIHATENVAPARVGDTLGLGILLLHPFEDGNGRTARMMGLMFRDNYDKPGYEADFDALAESRDVVRATDGRIPVTSYVPYMPDGASQNNAGDVKNYFDSLLSDGDSPRLYMGLGGSQAPLYDQAPVSPVEQVTEQ